MYNRNATPLNVENSTFYNVNKTVCKLYVPKGSYMFYWLAAEWSDFENIIESDFTSISIINSDNIPILPISNGITIETIEQTPISVFNISGQKVIVK